ncbi:MAG TPA: FAD-dependent oxidoreductase [Edaphobacter sp.]|nr:FAD-dependent oxidoreductase [Edaphobacter sp.]
MSIDPNNDIVSRIPHLRPELAFPCLTDDMIDRIRPYGQDICFLRDSSLFKPGERDVDMFVILKGSIEIYSFDESGEQRNLIVRLQETQFTGELDLFNSHRTMVHACTSDESTLLRIPRAELKRLMRSEGDIANLIMQAMIWRRQGLLADESTAMMVWAETGLPETVQLQRFLMRNGYPHRMTVPTPEQLTHLRILAPASVENLLPAVALRDGRVMFSPTIEDLADELGITQLPDIGAIYDVAIIGAGPSGLAAAVYAASEGLSALIIEGTAPGGQAGTSSKIENYLGFPTGVSGQELASRAQMQAQKFGARLALSREAVRIDQHAGVHEITLRGETCVCSRSVVIATGARYRKLNVANYGRYENQGIYYAATAMEANLVRGHEIAVIGGGNSAGQAAIFLSGVASRVHLVIRGDSLSSTMSQYLISRIESSDHITLHRNTEITKLEGDTKLTGVSWTDKLSGRTETRPIRGVFVMIGAEPNTGWLFGTLLLDKKGFIVTGTSEAFETSRYATSVPGIFAIGDVRSTSVKRVASAVGEGSIVISDVHRFLAENRVGPFQGAGWQHTGQQPTGLNA